MALAGKLKRFGESSWNPLRVTDTELPPQLLLMAKIVVVGLVLRNYHLGLPDVFAPFFEWMEIFPAPWYRRVLRMTFIVCGTALLLNRAVRTNCLILGSLFLVGTLSSKVYYRNAKVFVGLLLFLTGLQERGKPPWMIWWQLAIMYFGAGLNKLFEADWRTGQYFDHFLTAIYQSDVYQIIRHALPGMWVARLMCWSIIALELTAGVMFTIGRLRPTAVWLAASVHVGAALLVAGDYGIYVAAVLASYMSCISWPTGLDASVDSRSRWRAAKPIFSSLDQDHLVRWRNRSGSPPQLVLRSRDRTWTDWSALGRLIMWTPALYFAAMVFLTAFSGDMRVWVVRSAASLGVVVLFWTLVASIRKRTADGSSTSARYAA
jgi:hypothetical protein